MAVVFISYNRESKSIVKTLVSDIEALGHAAWFDQEISGGRTWWDQILDKVRECDIFIFIVDPQSLSSEACKREYGYAADLGKSILPVLVSDQVSPNLLPPALARIQFVDYSVADREAAFRLARALTTISTSPPLPDPLPTPPEAPISYLENLAERVESATPLTYEEQSVLVADLRRSLRDAGTSEHAQSLLEALRRRRDLLAVIADEVDDLLRNVAEIRPEPTRPSRRPTSPPPDNPILRVISLVRDWVTRYLGIFGRRFLSPETRLGAALRAGLIGYLFSSIAIGIAHIAGAHSQENDVTYSALMFALIGAIAGKNNLANLAALVLLTIAAAATVAAGSSSFLIWGDWAAALMVFIFFLWEKRKAYKR